MGLSHNYHNLEVTIICNIQTDALLEFVTLLLAYTAYIDDILAMNIKHTKKHIIRCKVFN